MPFANAFNLYLLSKICLIVLHLQRTLLLLVKIIFINGVPFAKAFLYLRKKVLLMA